MDPSGGPGALLLVIVAGLAVGFANTLASSGSAISLPILLGLGMAPELANGTNRVAVLVGAATATVSFARAGRINWSIVTPLAITGVIGSLIGVWISEVLSPARMHWAIVIAECLALAMLVIRPSRWVQATGENPHVGPLQLIWMFLIGVWTGFIILDGGTYMIILFVLSVGMDLLGANAAKAVAMATIAAVTLPVLAVGGNVEWRSAAIMSAGAMVGGLVAAKVAMIQGIARWVYRLIVAILAGELAHLAYNGLWMM